MDSGLDVTFLEFQPNFPIVKIDLQGKVVGLHSVPYVCNFLNVLVSCECSSLFIGDLSLCVYMMDARSLFMCKFGGDLGWICSGTG